MYLFSSPNIALEKGCIADYLGKKYITDEVPKLNLDTTTSYTISNTNYTNPYDFTVGNGGALLRATFTSPSGVVKTIDGFYVQEYSVTNISNGSLQAGEIEFPVPLIRARRNAKRESNAIFGRNPQELLHAAILSKLAAALLVFFAGTARAIIVAAYLGSAANRFPV